MIDLGKAATAIESTEAKPPSSEIGRKIPDFSENGANINIEKVKVSPISESRIPIFKVDGDNNGPSSMKNEIHSNISDNLPGGDNAENISEQLRDKDLTSSEDSANVISHKNDVADDTSENMNTVDDGKEIKIKELKDEYIVDVVNNSEVPDTIDKEKASNADFEKQSPEHTGELREEFDQVKNDLKKQWEIANGMEWPKYKEDVYSANDKLIRRDGDDYDAHHIQPLGMGGKNEASNITPLHAECHYDKQGVHSPYSPYSKLDKELGA